MVWQCVFVWLTGHPADPPGAAPLLCDVVAVLLWSRFWSRIDAGKNHQPQMSQKVNLSEKQYEEKRYQAKIGEIRNVYEGLCRHPRVWCIDWWWFGNHFGNYFTRKMQQTGPKPRTF